MSKASEKQSKLIESLKKEIRDVASTSTEISQAYKSLSDSCLRTQKAKDKMSIELTARLVNLEKNLAKCKQQKDALFDKWQRLDSQYKLVLKEKDKLKSKLVRLQNVKKQAANVLKTCVNCKEEFSEKENFNWSCRTH